MDHALPQRREDKMGNLNFLEEKAKRLGNRINERKTKTIKFIER